MARKNKTLPKDFKEIIKQGDFEKFKSVFNKCDINAYDRYGYGSNTALFFPNLTLEMVNWLIGQGADINYKNHYRNTPLTLQVSYKSNQDIAKELKDLAGIDLEITKDNSDIVKLLIELGAEVNPETGRSPLVEACCSINLNAVNILLQNANYSVDIRKEALEELLFQFHPTPDTLKIAQLLLSLDTPTTDLMREYVSVMGERFEDRKITPPNPEYEIFEKHQIEKMKPVMSELYRLFDVEPIKPRILYDGVSPIMVDNTVDLQSAFFQLWDYLVPPKGQCSTVQGEVIRITGKISGEIYRNGGMNWRNDHKKMLKALIDYFQMGNSLKDYLIDKTNYLINKVYDGDPNYYDETVELTNLAVLWVKDNPEPIKIHKTIYKY